MKFKTWEDRRDKREKLEQVVEDFQDAANQYYGGHAYSTGYLGSALISTLLDHVDEAEIATTMRHLMETTIHMQKQALLETIKGE